MHVSRYDLEDIFFYFQLQCQQVNCCHQGNFARRWWPVLCIRLILCLCIRVIVITIVVVVDNGDIPRDRWPVGSKPQAPPTIKRLLLLLQSHHHPYLHHRRHHHHHRHRHHHHHQHHHHQHHLCQKKNHLASDGRQDPLRNLVNSSDVPDVEIICQNNSLNPFITQQRRDIVMAPWSADKICWSRDWTFQAWTTLGAKWQLFVIGRPERW